MPAHLRPTGRKFVLQVAPDRFRARIYTGGGRAGRCQVTLGSYLTAEAAAGAVRATAARLRGTSPLDVWEAIRPLVAKGVVARTVLPKYVFRRPDGRYGARVRRGRRRDELGPFDDPAEACRAMIDLLARVPA